MHRTQQNICALEHCGKPAPHTTICNHCTKETRTALYALTRDEINRLYAIARGQEQPAETTARKTRTTQPSEVLKLATWLLAENLNNHYPKLLPHLQTHPNATHYYWKILSDTEKAQTIINGHQLRFTLNDYQEAMRKAPINTAENTSQWLRKKLGINVTPNQIRLMKHRGKIKPVGQKHTGTKPADLWHPMTIIRALHNTNKK